MQPISLRQRHRAVTLTLAAAVDISQAATLHKTLTQALALGLPVRVNPAKLERVDTTALQLLLAFERSARARGVDIVCAQRSAVLDDSARQLGLPMPFAGAA